MAYGFVLRSPHAAARIKGIDTRAAKQSPGVLAVLTYEDWKASGFGDLPVGSGQKTPRRLAHVQPSCSATGQRSVRAHVGDYIAFIVADSVAEAMERPSRSQVDYESLPAVGRPNVGAQAGRASGLGRMFQQHRLRQAAGQQGEDRCGMAKASDWRETALRHQPGFSQRHGTAWLCWRLQHSADDHYTLYTTIQGAHPYRSRLASRILKTYQKTKCALSWATWAASFRHEVRHLPRGRSGPAGVEAGWPPGSSGPQPAASP